MDPQTNTQAVEAYIDKLANALVKRNIDQQRQLQFNIQPIFDTTLVTCVVTKYSSPEDIGLLIECIREAESPN